MKSIAINTKLNYSLRLKYYLRFVAVLFCLISTELFAQHVGAEAKLDTNCGLIGDQIKLSLRFTVPASAQVIWPVFNDTLTKDIEILARSGIDSTFSDDKSMVTLNQILTITAFDSGYYQIPPIEFSYIINNDTSKNIFLTQALDLNIATIKVDTTAEFKDIKPPLKAPLTWQEIMPWIGLGLGVMLLIGLLIFIILRFRKKKPIFGGVVKPVESAHERALRELEKLRVERLWQQGRIKDFFISLSDIIRVYIDERYGILAMEMITEDILEEIKKAAIQSREIDRLHKILIMADMVKFAKFIPLPDECQNSLQNSVTFVQNTKNETAKNSVIENRVTDNFDNNKEETQDVHPVD